MQTGKNHWFEWIQACTEGVELYLCRVFDLFLLSLNCRDVHRIRLASHNAHLNRQSSARCTAWSGARQSVQMGMGSRLRNVVQLLHLCFQKLVSSLACMQWAWPTARDHLTAWARMWTANCHVWHMKTAILSLLQKNWNGMWLLWEIIWKAWVKM